MSKYFQVFLHDNMFFSDDSFWGGSYFSQSTNYTTTCLPSRKLSKLDEPDMQDTAGEAGTSS